MAMCEYLNLQTHSLILIGQQEYIGEVKHALSDADLSGTQTLLPISFDAQKQIGVSNITYV